MKTTLIVLLCYCAFAYGYGLSFLSDAFKDIVDESSEYYKADRPVFLAGAVLVLMWLVFPVLWPILQFLSFFDKTEYGN